MRMTMAAKKTGGEGLGDEELLVSPTGNLLH